MPVKWSLQCQHSHNNAFLRGITTQEGILPGRDTLAPGRTTSSAAAQVCRPDYTQTQGDLIQSTCTQEEVVGLTATYSDLFIWREREHWWGSQEGWAPASADGITYLLHAHRSQQSWFYKTVWQLLSGISTKGLWCHPTLRRGYWLSRQLEHEPTQLLPWEMNTVQYEPIHNIMRSCPMGEFQTW